VFPDDRWNARDRFLDERELALASRERLLDARQTRLTSLEDELTARRHRLDEREHLLAQREAAAEQREHDAGLRAARADSRELNATARERLLDERDAAEAGALSDPIGRIEQAFAREVARLDRSDEFLERSRAAVQRAQDRLEALRRTRPDGP
jgi:uncharacterized protein (DUF3084 family)